MAKLLYLLVFLSTTTWAQWKVGDVILQPRRCYLCSLIEAQERSTFSHMSVVVKVNQDLVLVADSLTQVRVLNLDQWLLEGDKTRAHKVYRLKEKLKGDLFENLQPFIGSEFDREFLWNNLGRDGREALYCSEFVTKLLNLSLKDKIPTKKMDYSVNRELWDQIFGGSAPHGLEGNSPADFERSPKFFEVAVFKDGTWNWK